MKTLVTYPCDAFEPVQITLTFETQEEWDDLLRIGMPDSFYYRVEEIRRERGEEVI